MASSSKDEWILDAIRKRTIVVLEDGTICRWRRSVPHGGREVLVPVTLSVHARTGRVYFNLTHDGVTKSVLVNRVVALALIPNPDGLPEVNHEDGNKANNRPDNLTWSNRSSQEKHAYETNLKTGRGSQNANAKLTAVDVLEIRLSDRSPYELAKIHKVSERTVRDVLERRTWRHL